MVWLNLEGWSPETLREVSRNITSDGPPSSAAHQLATHLFAAAKGAEKGDADPFEGVEITKATELQRYGQYVVQLDKVVSADAAEHILRTLKARFPTNSFAVAGPGVSVMEATRPAPENNRLVLHSGLVDSLKRAEAEAMRYWENGQGTERVAYAGAQVALEFLRKALATPERDGAATPPAEQPPTVTPAATGAGTADESATGGATPAAAPSPSEGRTAIKTPLGVTLTVDDSVYFALVSGYAVGRAQTRGAGATPYDEDYSAAREWYRIAGEPE